MGPNDPKINRTYNYVYRLINTITGMEYTGVHRTDNLLDGYMGSGKIIKRAIKKYGEGTFKKEIISRFDTYMEALEEERRLVTKEYINRHDTYNIREGGFGRCEWSDQHKKEFSAYKKKQWQDSVWKAKMLKNVYTKARAEKISQALQGKCRNNPQNKNPEKIRKTAAAHTGMKRSTEAKKKMSIAALNVSPDIKKKRSGIGCIYIHNPVTGEARRIASDAVIPDNWKRGTGKLKK
jgi:hypothetical protein